MRKEETWSVSVERARNFFDGQEDVIRTATDEYMYGTCRIHITQLKPKGMGIWAAKRIKVVMEGEESDVSEIYHRFFIQFLSTGG